jgi:hypothetical protein
MSNHLLDAEQQKSKNLEDLNQNARDINITSSFRSKLLHDFIELKALIRYDVFSLTHPTFCSDFNSLVRWL